jgi:hypothetical protein
LRLGVNQSDEGGEGPAVQRLRRGEAHPSLDVLQDPQIAVVENNINKKYLLFAYQWQPGVQRVRYIRLGCGTRCGVHILS